MFQCPPALRGEEELLLGLAGVAGWTFYADFSFDWSPAMYALFQLDPGCSSADVVARYHPDDRNHVTKSLTETFRKGEPTVTRYRIVWPNGETRHVLSKAMRRDGPNGPEIVGVNIDVTAQLREMEIDFEDVRRFKFIASNSRDLIIRYTPSGEITFASPASKFVLGFEVEDLIGVSIFDLLDKEIHPNARARLEARNRQEGPQGPQEYFTRRQDGSGVWLEGNPRPARNAFGEIIEWVDVLRDVSERKASQQALVKALADADAATAAKSEFLANMSHELRTPLTSIIGFANMVGQEQPLPPDDQRRLDHIVRASRTLLSVVNDVLDLSKLEEGALDLDPAPFDIVRLVDDAVNLLQPRAAEKNLQLQVRSKLGDGGPVWVLGDDLRLTQVLLNLLSNAVKFTDSGQVNVSLSYLSVSPEMLRFEIAVEDNGIGIAQDKIASLFERFTQADGSITRRFGGSGLGLSISYQLVALMNGTLSATSELGVGSRFVVSLELPISQAPGHTASPHEDLGNSALANPIQILLAEDNPANQELIRALLSATGAEITTVENGAQAVAMAQAQSFDLILMDIQMPVLDGVSATRAIRSMDGAAGRLPIIALSANVLQREVHQYEKAGFTGHVGKPIDPKRLIDAIVDALDAAQPPAAQAVRMA
jgi:PAS domain S-box-containing protein